MNRSSQTLIRVLLFETDSLLSAEANRVLHGKTALKLFHVITVSSLDTAYRVIEKEKVDMILLDLNPTDDPELVPLTRLRAHTPHLPVVALLHDEDQNNVLNVLDKGAQDYFFLNQVRDENFTAFLLRTSERLSSQKALRESEERFRLMIENASDVILILDGAGVVSYASPSTEHILNHPPAQLTGRNALDFIHRDDRLKFLDDFEKAFAKGDRLSFVQFRFRSPDERWIHLEGRGRIVPDQTGRKICILNSHDVSHRVKLEEELRSLSLRDELTGLHNRRSFVNYLDQQLKVAERTKKEQVYLLFIDLDEFKWINDNLGHKEGDRALVGASQILKNTFRDADIIARLGGDEFVVFLSETNRDLNVENLKKRLYEGVDDWNNKEQKPYRLKMSVGVVQHNPSERPRTESLLAQADELMYQQKREKKRGISSASPQGNLSADLNRN